MTVENQAVIIHTATGQHRDELHALAASPVSTPLVSTLPGTVVSRAIFTLTLEMVADPFFVFSFFIASGKQW